MTPELPGMEAERRDPAKSQWYTPPELAQRIVEWALEFYDGQESAVHALEPSAGRGALAVPLAKRVKQVTCVDIDEQNAEYLTLLGFETHRRNFLSMSRPGGGPLYELAVMNPPFEGGQTEHHILHALQFADRVVCHCPLTTLAGQARRASLWSKVDLSAIAICSTRPKYGADGGKTDMCTIDVRRACRHREMYPDYPHEVRVEWWP